MTRSSRTRAERAEQSRRDRERALPRATRRSVRIGAAHAVVALAVGTAVAAGAVTLLVTQREASIAEERADPPPELTPGDRTREALAELRRDGVYVAPDGRDMMDEAGEERVEAAVAANPLPVYVIVWADGQELGINQIDLRDQVVRELGPDPGILYVWEGPRTGSVDQVGPRGVYLDGDRYDTDFAGDAADFLVAAAQEVRIDESLSDYDPDSETDSLGGPVGGGVLGLLAGLGVVGVAVLAAAILRAVRGRGLPGRWRWTEGGAR